VGEHDDHRREDWRALTGFDVWSNRLADGGPVVVGARGELDLHTAPELERALAAVADGAARLIVDLSAATFIDSTTLHVLLVQARRTEAAGGELVVVAADPNVRRVFEITGFDRLFSVVPALEAAPLPT
jgi:anti-sigma B factor antagonist